MNCKVDMLGTVKFTGIKGFFSYIRPYKMSNIRQLDSTCVSIIVILNNRALKFPKF